MLVFSKLSNILFTVVVALLLTLFSALSVILYSGKEIIQNRELVKEAVKSEKLREIYMQQILLDSNGDDPLVIDEAQLQTVSNDEIDKSIDQSIDAIYEWLEGKSDSPAIAITPQETESDPLHLEELAEQRIGGLAQFLDYEKLNEAIDKEVTIVDFNSDEADYLPEIYQRLDKLTRNTLIITAILSGLLIISASNLRQGVFILGVGYLGAAAILLLGPNFISDNHQNVRYEAIPFLKLPNPDELSLFTKEIIIQLSDDLLRNISRYGKYLLGVSIMIIVLSQIAIRRRDIDDDYQYESEDRPRRQASSPTHLEQE